MEIEDEERYRDCAWGSYRTVKMGKIKRKAIW